MMEMMMLGRMLVGRSRCAAGRWTGTRVWQMQGRGCVMGWKKRTYSSTSSANPSPRLIIEEGKVIEKPMPIPDDMFRGVPDPPIISAEIPVNEQPSLVTDPGLSTMSVLLNRPLSLNHIDADVTNSLSDILLKWGSREKQTWMIFLKGAQIESDDEYACNTAFCTGFDIKSIAEEIQAGNKDAGQADLLSFSNLCARLAHIRKPIAAVGDGLIIGSGTGLFANTSVRLATNDSCWSITDPLFGMTPTGGLFSRMLEGMPAWHAAFLALSGRRVTGSDMVRLGIATHYVPASRLQTLDESIQELAPQNLDEALVSLYEVSESLDPISYQDHLDTIESVFSLEKVSDMIKTLENFHLPWTNELVKLIRSRSPLSLVLCNHMIRTSEQLPIHEAIKMEHRIASHLLKHEEFQRGTEAMKEEREANWMKTLEEVEAEKLDYVLKETESESQIDVADPLPHQKPLNRKRAQLLANAMSKMVDKGEDGHNSFLEYMVRTHVPRSKNEEYKRFAKVWMANSRRRPEVLEPVDCVQDDEVIFRGTVDPLYFTMLEARRCEQQRKLLVPFIAKRDLTY